MWMNNCKPFTITRVVSMLLATVPCSRIFQSHVPVYSIKYLRSSASETFSTLHQQKLTLILVSKVLMVTVRAWSLKIKALGSFKMSVTTHSASCIHSKNRFHKLSAVIKVNQVKARFIDSYPMHNENLHTHRPMFTTLVQSLKTNHFSPQLQIKLFPKCNIMYLAVGHIIILQFPAPIC